MGEKRKVLERDFWNVWGSFQQFLLRSSSSSVLPESYGRSLYSFRKKVIAKTTKYVGTNQTIIVWAGPMSFPGCAHLYLEIFSRLSLIRDLLCQMGPDLLHFCEHERVITY